MLYHIFIPFQFMSIDRRTSFSTENAGASSASPSSNLLISSLLRQDHPLIKSKPCSEHKQGHKPVLMRYQQVNENKRHDKDQIAKIILLDECHPLPSFVKPYHTLPRPCWNLKESQSNCQHSPLFHSPRSAAVMVQFIQTYVVT